MLFPLLLCSWKPFYYVQGQTYNVSFTSYMAHLRRRARLIDKIGNHSKSYKLANFPKLDQAPVIS